MHRDIKAANLLIDDDGTVLLGDLGVATFLWDPEDQRPQSSGSDHQRVISFDQQFKQHLANSHAHPIPRPKLGKRKSFVGTVGFDRIAHLKRYSDYDGSPSAVLDGPGGHTGSQVRRQSRYLVFRNHRARTSSGPAPAVARTAPQRAFEDVSILTNSNKPSLADTADDPASVQDPSPVLDRTGGSHKYSKAFQEMVGQCLEKDPAKRPSAAELLSSPFFRTARKGSHLVGTVLSKKNFINSKIVSADLSLNNLIRISAAAHSAPRTT